MKDTDYLDNFIEHLTDKEIRELNNEDEVTEKDIKFAMQVVSRVRSYPACFWRLKNRIKKFYIKLTLSS